MSESSVTAVWTFKEFCGKIKDKGELNKMGISFAAAFMRIYDRKIASGEISFSELKMDKSLFNNICIVPDFVLPKEETERLCDKMNVSEEEREMLMSYYEE